MKSFGKMDLCFEAAEQCMIDTIPISTINDDQKLYLYINVVLPIALEFFKSDLE